MKAKGFSLLELVLVLALLALLSAVALPRNDSLWRRSALTQAALRVLTDAQRCQQLAAQRLAHVGMVFDVDERGTFYVLVADGNGNGVSRRDYLTGRDRVLAGPVYFSQFSGPVRLGLTMALPAPNGSGLLPPGGLAFGRAGILSFSPTLGATSGTLVLSTGEEVVALRVAPMGALRLFRWSHQRQSWLPFHF
jgi:prepilin-type N-terminal cleavage/methylation domain-containing protein